MTVMVPNVGAVVRVKTRHKNIYHLDADTIPFVEKIYEGRVLPNEKFDKLESFCITGDEAMPVRNISLTNVVSIDYLKGGASPRSTVVRKFHVKSSSGNKEYVVEVVGDQIRCSCPGHIYHRKCKHADAVREKLK